MMVLASKAGSRRCCSGLACGGGFCALRPAAYLVGSSKVNIKVRGDTACLCGSHFSQRTREMGHPFWIRPGGVKVKIKVKGKSERARVPALREQDRTGGRWVESIRSSLILPALR